MATPSPSPASPALRKLAVAAAFAIVLGLAWQLRGVLVPLFLAFLVAYALDPFVDWLEARKVPRTIAAVLVMGGLSTLAVAALLVAIPCLADEFRTAGEQLPAQLAALQARVEPFVAGALHVEVPHTWGELASRLHAELDSRLPDLAQGLTVALFGTINVILIVIGTFIIPVFALYLLIDFDRNVARARTLVPRRFAPFVESVAREIHATLGRYVRGQFMANFVLAVLYAAGLSLVGIRLAIPIGVVTGLLAFVPYVGFATGLLLAMAMAVLDWHGVDHIAATVGVMLGVQLLDGMVITPRIVGESVGLRPIEVLLTMMAAATLFGFLGVLLAVPLGAVVKILAGRLIRLYLASPFYSALPAAEPAPAGGSTGGEGPSEAA